jgi:hypothetical protein
MPTGIHVARSPDVILAFAMGDAAMLAVTMRTSAFWQGGTLADFDPLRTLAPCVLRGALKSAHLRKRYSAQDSSS